MSAALNVTLHNNGYWRNQGLYKVQPDETRWFYKTHMHTIFPLYNIWKLSLLSKIKAIVKS